MATRQEVRSFLNAVSEKEFGKKYKSLSDNQASKVRKKAVNLAFKRRKKK